ncbi:MAG: FHA domain-containing protein, partial [Bacteriovoracaceae bacterium]|nr:FHA domain-containing protein [Bacteriovoracaceae bacterium]
MAVYELTFQILDDEPQIITIENEIVVGSSENADIQIVDDNVLDTHIVFTVKNDTLSVKNFSKSGSYIGDQELKEKKSYILENGDEIEIPSCGITVSSAETTNDTTEEFAADTDEEEIDLE